MDLGKAPKLALTLALALALTLAPADICIRSLSAGAGLSAGSGAGLSASASASAASPKSVIIREKTMNKQNNGQILRLKTGYNPNSSSVGSDIPIFLGFAAGSGALTILILHILNFYDRHIREKKADIKEQ